MKNNISYYQHDANSHNDWRFKMLIKMLGWAAEAKCFRLFNFIASAADCLLDIQNKNCKLSTAADLDFTETEFEQFIETLLSLNLIHKIDGKITSEDIQQILSQVNTKRKKDRNWVKKNKDTKNSTVENENSTVENEQSKDSTDIKEEERDIAAEPLVFPFLEKDFLHAWEKWKKYRNQKYNETYLLISEQEALNKLKNISGENFQKAIAIINESIASGWKHLRELETEIKKEQAQIYTLPQTQLSKTQLTINELFKKFIKNETHVTIISTEVVQFNELQKAGLIVFSKKQWNDIERKAKKECKEYRDETTIHNIIKRFSVIEFFKHHKAKGFTTVFQQDQNGLVASK